MPLGEFCNCNTNKIANKKTKDEMKFYCRSL